MTGNLLLTLRINNNKKSLYDNNQLSQLSLIQGVTLSKMKLKKVGNVERKPRQAYSQAQLEKLETEFRLVFCLT